MFLAKLLVIVLMHIASCNNSETWTTTEIESNGIESAETYLERQVGKHLLVTLKIFATVSTLSLSGIISGLHLAVMSFDIIELRCILISGTSDERENARRLLPLRQRSNYLLSVFVLSECAFDAATTLLIESMTNDWIALLVATLLITIFGGILPEALTFRYGLKIAGSTMCLTHTVSYLALPLAWPIARLLDVAIGEDIGQVRNRKYLAAYVEIISKTTGMCQMEVSAMKGTLSLRDKSIQEIMTPLKDVFMLDYEATIDSVNFMTILRTGYSRIPIYHNDRHNIVGLLHIKEIAAAFAYDISSKVPVSFMLLAVKRELIFVSATASLSKDYLLKQFERGTHLAFVCETPSLMYANKSIEQQITVNLNLNNSNSNEGKDKATKSDRMNDKSLISKVSNVNRVIGIVTLEDVVEEILQTEIVDETDTISDNKRKEKISKIYTQELINALDQRRSPGKNQTALPEGITVSE
jgi:metal transporter CNNM